MIIPIGGWFIQELQSIIRQTQDQYTTEHLGAVIFVSMIEGTD